MKITITTIAPNTTKTNVSNAVFNAKISDTKAVAKKRPVESLDGRLGWGWGWNGHYLICKLTQSDILQIFLTFVLL